jgi:hypothetical protein
MRQRYYENTEAHRPAAGAGLLPGHDEAQALQPLRVLRAQP